MIADVLKLELYDPFHNELARAAIGLGYNRRLSSVSNSQS